MEQVISREKLFQKIDSYKDELIYLEEKFTSIPALSPGTGGKGEWEKAQFLKSYMEKIGYDSMEEINAPDPMAQNGVRPSLIYRYKGHKSDKTIWIMTHLDIVDPGERNLWNSDPYKIKVEGNKIYGRGVEDNQQGLISSILAIKALREEGITPEYDIALLFIADEETGSQYGIQYILETKPEIFKKEDLIIIPDGGNQDGTMIEVAEKSILWVKFTTIGKQAHGSRPDSGINAHNAAAHLIVKLNELYKIYDYNDPVFEPSKSTFEATKKEDNVPNVNSIPGKDVFYIDCRILPNYDVDEVIKTINKMVQEIEEQFKVKINAEFPQNVQAAPATSVDAPVVKAMYEAVKDVYKVEAKPMGIGGGTVAAHIRRLNLPSIVWSKSDETAHQPNEYCIMENVLGDAKVFTHIFLQK